MDIHSPRDRRSTRITEMEKLQVKTQYQNKEQWYQQEYSCLWSQELHQSLVPHRILFKYFWLIIGITRSTLYIYHMYGILCSYKNIGLTIIGAAKLNHVNHYLFSYFSRIGLITHLYKKNPVAPHPTRGKKITNENLPLPMSIMPV